MKKVKMTDEQMEAMAPGEYTTWEKRVWRRGYEAALSQQPEVQCGEELPSPLNGDFDCPKAAAARSCPCGFCRALRTPSAPAAVDEAAAIRAFEEHFNASADDPYFEGELELWLAAWRAALAQQPEARGGGDVIQRHVVTKYRDGSVHVADVAALAQPPACKSRIEQVAQEVLAEHEGDEAFDFLKAVVGKIVARATQ